MNNNNNTLIEGEVGNLGHLKTYDIIDMAKEYVVKYYETDNLKYLNTPKLYDKLKEAARRWALADLSRDKNIDNPENHIDIVSHEAVSAIYIKIQKKEVDLELFSYYYKTIIRNRICDVFREYADDRKLKNADAISIEDSLQFSSEEEITELLEIRDKARVLIKFIKNSLKTELITHSSANLLIIPILICVIRDSNKLIDNYPFRLRVFLKKVVFEARTLYLREFLR
jgi:hypothetical protein